MSIYESFYKNMNAVLCCAVIKDALMVRESNMPVKAENVLVVSKHIR